MYSTAICDVCILKYGVKNKYGKQVTFGSSDAMKDAIFEQVCNRGDGDCSVNDIACYAFLNSIREVIVVATIAVPEPPPLFPSKTKPL